MGFLLDGHWYADGAPVPADVAALDLPPSRFAGEVRADGQAGADGRTFALAKDRYHLIISPACPFARRTFETMRQAGLQQLVSCAVLEEAISADGWAFAGHAPYSSASAQPDSIMGARFLRELYVAADKHYTGRVTVPVLWDKQGGTIVSNASADIQAMFTGIFQQLRQA